jgi:hypothetical protein
MNGIVQLAAPLGWRELTRANAVGNRLKCAARGDLRVAPFVDVRPNPQRRRRAGVAACGPEAVEAQAIDRLEWQLVLKTRLGASVQLPGRRDRSLAIEFRAVALETQWSRGSSELGGRVPGFPLQCSQTSCTQRLWSFAFQLSAWKANPLIPCKLTVFLCHGRQSNRCQ